MRSPIRVAALLSSFGTPHLVLADLGLGVLAQAAAHAARLAKEQTEALRKNGNAIWDVVRSRGGEIAANVDVSELLNIHDKYMPLLSAFVAKNESYLRAEAEKGAWLTCYETEKLVVWHRQAVGSRLHEFRACGSFDDISAMAFVDATSDVAFRRIWDKTLEHVDYLARLPDGTEILSWELRYPWPLSNRLYLYARKAVMDAVSGVLIQSCRVTNDPAFTSFEKARRPGHKVQRVQTCVSSLLVRPHNDNRPLEKGMDVCFEYFDDPGGNLPAWAINLCLHHMLPDFIKRLTDAARQLQEREDGRPRHTIGADRALHHQVASGGANGRRFILL